MRGERAHTGRIDAEDPSQEDDDIKQLGSISAVYI